MKNWNKLLIIGYNLIQNTKYVKVCVFYSVSGLNFNLKVSNRASINRFDLSKSQELREVWNAPVPRNSGLGKKKTQKNEKKYYQTT